MRDAIWLRVRAALSATGAALILGSAAAFAIARFRFFGRESVSSAHSAARAPRIITGMALNSFFTFTHTDLASARIVIGHATFCVVIVYNNVLARLAAILSRCSKRPPTSAPTGGRRSGS